MSDLTHPSASYDLFGHGKVWQQLLDATATHHLPSGFLITGPQGIGKSTLAYRFARFLLAGEGGLPEADHPICKRIEAHSHSDLLVVEPEFDAKKGEVNREISVERARAISEFLSLTSGESQWRVVIIDAVDQLNRFGANAILKILEEPPPNAILLLISHNPGQLLPTIRSRCHMLKCAPLKRDDFNDVLRAHAPELSIEEKMALGELSQWSPGLALHYHHQNALELYAQMLDVLGQDTLPDSALLWQLAEDIGSQKSHSQQRLCGNMLLTLCQRLTKHSSGLGLVPLHAEEEAVFDRVAPLNSPLQWAGKWQQAGQQLAQAERLYLDYKQWIITFFHSMVAQSAALR